TGAPMSSVTIAATTPVAMNVRESTYDAASRSFSAVVEIPPGDPKAQFVPLHGVAFPTVSVPVLKESAAKNTGISENMITNAELPEDAIRGTMITDASYLVGKAPKIFLKAGQPIFETEVAQISLVDVPVLTVDMSRDQTITKQEITTVTLNAAEL